jgi:hypothetical protein
MMISTSFVIVAQVWTETERTGACRGWWPGTSEPARRLMSKRLIFSDLEEAR